MLLWLAKTIIYFFVIHNVCSEISDITIVNTDQGRVRGYINLVDRYVYYLGIPYASLNERFAISGDPPTWNDTFNANRQVVCKQFSPITKTITGVEDCLVLNIYKPITSQNKTGKLPVIVFIHGGGFNWGSNNNILYDPRLLLRKNVIVVTINYRLGAFGFLCLRNGGAPGNVGIKDQVAAIKWVNKNIAAFGGDPNSVTLFGESAGAVSINFLILTRTAKGLYQRAIMDSGSVTVFHLFDRNPIETAIEIGNSMNFNTTDTDELLQKYRNATADEIVMATTRDSTNNAFASYIFRVCVENKTIENAIVTDTPLNLLKKASDVGNLSVIQGYNNKEGIMWATFYNNEGLRMLDGNFSSAIPESFLFKDDQDKSMFVSDVRSKYFANSTTTVSGLIDYFSDALIMYPSVLNMESFLSNNNITMFNFFFKYDSLRNLNKLVTRLFYVPGANHGDELFYLFDPIFYQLLPMSPKDSEIIDAMVTFWTNFAKTGNPSSRDITWPRSETTLNFLYIGNEIKAETLPNESRIEFWRRSQENYGFFD